MEDVLKVGCHEKSGLQHMKHNKNRSIAFCSIDMAPNAMPKLFNSDWCFQMSRGAQFLPAGAAVLTEPECFACHG